MLELTAGMVVFFGLSILLTGMRDEGERARRFMIIMTAAFSGLFALQVILK